MATKRGLPREALARVRDLLAPDGRVISVRPLRGGISSSVHLVRVEAADGTRQGVIVRRYGEYWLRVDPASCEREFKLLQVLSRSSLAEIVPKPLLLDAEGGLFGAPTVVMTRLPGRPMLVPPDISDYLEQAARTLARLHAVPADELSFLTDQRVHVARALSDERAPRSDALQEDVWAAAQAAWLPVRDTSHVQRLVHGDYWPGNLLWKRGRLVGVIDWEQPRLGDSVKDVATCRGDLSIIFGLDAADEFTQRYIQAGGAPVEHLRFWDLLISTWALREIEGWAVVYPPLRRPDLTAGIAQDRIRAFARAALARSEP